MICPILIWSNYNAPLLNGSKKYWNGELQMKIRQYDNNGIKISRLGLGCMRMSVSPKSIFKRSESIATIRAAIDAGINFINTGTFYGIANHNLKLIGETIKRYKREQVFISLKYGNFNPLSLIGLGNVDVGPKNAKKYLFESLKHLGLDYIELYQPARIDIGIPLEETMGILSELVKEGYVKYIGLSEVDANTLRKAHAILPLSFVELNYSITNNSIEKELLPTARELGIGIVAFGLSGLGKLFKAKEDPLTDTIYRIATEKNVTPTQIAHAWIYTKGDDIITLLGARTIPQLEDSIKSTEINFSKDDIHRIENSMKKSKIVGPNMPKIIIKNGKIVH